MLLSLNRFSVELVKIDFKREIVLGRVDSLLALEHSSDWNKYYINQSEIYRRALSEFYRREISNLSVLAKNLNG